MDQSAICIPMLYVESNANEFLSIKTNLKYGRYSFTYLSICLFINLFYGITISYYCKICLYVFVPNTSVLTSGGSGRPKAWKLATAKKVKKKPTAEEFCTMHY